MFVFMFMFKFMLIFKKFFSEIGQFNNDICGGDEHTNGVLRARHWSRRRWTTVSCGRSWFWTIRIVVAAPGRPIGCSSFGFDNDSGYTELQIGANLKKCQQTIKSFKNFVEFASTNLSQEAESNARGLSCPVQHEAISLALLSSGCLVSNDFYVKAVAVLAW